jgi:hypothetical protein
MKDVMKKTSLFTAISLLTGLIFISCDDSTTSVVEEFDPKRYDIYFGSFGGLCGYSDSMSITMNLDLDYTLKEFCSGTDFQTKEPITQEEYLILINSLPISSFQKLNYNSCDRCVDGLDTFLHITGSEDFSHRIVYGSEDDLSSISDFIEHLNDIRESLKPE